MAQSAQFEYVPVTIPKACLRSLWTLSLSENEWAGRLKLDSSCAASCGTDLIEGSFIEKTVDAHSSKLYLGKEDAVGTDGKTKPIRTASVYIPETDYTASDSCAKGKANVVFHTHPLLLVRDQETRVARVALPSMGDIYVHCVHSNLLNYEANGHINCTLVVAFEGLYMYTILPHKFRQIYDQVARETGQGRSRGEVMTRLQQQTFDELRPANKAFFKAMKAHCDAHPEEFGTDGAPNVQNKLWGCKGCVVDGMSFGYARAIRTPLVRDYARDNPFTKGLNEHGYHCEFFPAPFDTDLTLLAPSSVTFVENRT